MGRRVNIGEANAVNTVLRALIGDHSSGVEGAVRTLAARARGALGAGMSPSEISEAIDTLRGLGPDAGHLIEFRDDGWTVQHPLVERLGGSLFDCPLSKWSHDDPGVRGRFELRPDGTLGNEFSGGPR
jgi:hypothetical protein